MTTSATGCGGCHVPPPALVACERVPTCRAGVVDTTSFDTVMACSRSQSAQSAPSALRGPGSSSPS